MKLSFRPARRVLLRVVLAVGSVLFVIALLVFEPWKLVVDRQVDEPLPAAAPAGPSAAAPAAVPDSVPDSAPVVLARGRLIGHEHASSGEAVVLRLADGSRVLRLQDLDTSDGPRLRVWLSSAPVIEGNAGWYVFADAPHLDLGDLKGNVGSSNYALPADADLAALPSVTIWCERFSVSFAATALEPVT